MKTIYDMEQDSFTKNVRYIVNYHKMFAKHFEPTKAQQEDWINRIDFDLSIEAWEHFFPGDAEDIPFDKYYERYNILHRNRYGYELLIDYSI